MRFVPTSDVTPITLPDPSTFKQTKLSIDSVVILNEIVAICHQKNIDIIFYTSPSLAAYAYVNAMTQFAAKNNCVYFNLFEYIDEIGINEETDFADEMHLNNNGAIKVADFLSQYIVNNYNVTDMRTVENNIWEQNSSD